MKVRLKAGKDKKLLNYYPFGYAADILEAEAGIVNGDLVDVHAESGTFVGRGYYNENGSIPLRMLTLRREPVDLKFFEKRINRALERRKSISGTNAMRILHAEADGMPGVVVDRFGDTLAVQLRNLGVEKQREVILEALRNVTGAGSAFERSDTGERGKEGLEQTKGTLWGDLPAKVEFFEDDLSFEFSPMESQKTGFFLDQRDNRRLMRSFITPGMKFLDVYSYVGAFSLHAARAGAKTLAVDKDSTALHTLETLAKRNNVASEVGMRMGDALEVLGAIEKEGRKFGAAVFDPPTLAKRKDDVSNAKRIFADGCAKVMRMLEPGGILLVSSCSHYMRLEDMLDACRLAAGQAERQAEVLTATYQPADHPWMLLVPESLYLKSLLLRVE